MIKIKNSKLVNSILAPVVSIAAFSCSHGNVRQGMKNDDGPYYIKEKPKENKEGEKEAQELLERSEFFKNASDLELYITDINASSQHGKNSFSGQYEKVEKYWIEKSIPGGFEKLQVLSLVGRSHSKESTIASLEFLTWIEAPNLEELRITQCEGGLKYFAKTNFQKLKKLIIEEGEWCWNGWDSIKRMNAKGIAISKADNSDNPSVIGIELCILRPTVEDIFTEFPKKYTKSRFFKELGIFCSSSNARYDNDHYYCTFRMKVVDLKILMADWRMFCESKEFRYRNYLLLRN